MISEDDFKDLLIDENNKEDIFVLAYNEEEPELNLFANEEDFPQYQPFTDFQTEKSLTDDNLDADYKITSSSILSGENVDLQLLDKYKSQLIKLLKIKKSDYDKMDGQSRLFLFTNFFKFIAERYYAEYGIKLDNDEDILDYGALLLALDKNFAKKLRDYAKEFINFVFVQIRKNNMEKKQLKKLRQEALVLIKYINTPQTMSTIVYGNARIGVDKKVGLIDYRTDANAYKREVAINYVQNFLGKNNLLNGNKAKTVAPVNKFNKDNYNSTIELFNPENFYSLDKDSVINLMNSLVTNYCAKNNTPAPTVETGTFAKPAEGKFVFGCNYTNTNTVVINEDLLKVFDQCKKKKDPTLPARIMQTCIHEAEHSVQNHKGMKFCGKTKSSEDFLEYARQAEEVGARNAAIKEMKEFEASGLLSKDMQAKLSQFEAEESRLKSEIQASA